ncbi:unnamed protein product [Caenorhabditis angaria]|uniref:Major sperm protein n=1 Tax=Caenorhabditis angaria TaxID=860376 RepID=A0A9P1IS88_9PELO|nr:unnamed protein product [Caenorhabditis angaria]
MDSDVSMNWIKERIHDQKHFTARWLDSAAKASGQKVENLAKVFVVGLIVLLIVADNQAHFFANLILVLVPFLLVFVYPEEQPTERSLLVYFITFGFLTTLDRNLEKLPLYYVIKLAILLLLYLPPFSLWKSIDENVKKMVADEKSQENTKKDHLNSMETLQSSEPAPPSSTESFVNKSTRNTVSTSRRSLVTAREKRDEQSAPLNQVMADQTASTAKSFKESEKSTQQSTRLATLDSSAKASMRMPLAGEAMNSKSGTDLADGSRRLKLGQNPMENGSFHNLKSDTDGFNSTMIGPANNLNDLVFFPMNSLIFNAPFDFDNLTYHMKIRNNSHHRIAYAVKGNAVPRVMVYPPVGIFDVKETKVFAVTVQKFDYNLTDFEKDRIAFDYVILPDNCRDQMFSLKMFQNADSKRRKNIRVLYNP